MLDPWRFESSLPQTFEVLSRCGDLLDAFAARVAAASFPLPTSVRQRIAEAPPEVQAEVEAAVHDRVAETMAAQAAPVFCRAADYYRAAGTPRATDPLARYGEAFLATCAPSE